MIQGLSTSAKVTLVSSVVESLTGERPSVRYFGNNQARISFSKSQSEKLRSFIEGKIKGSSTPPDMVIDYMPVLFPVLLKKALPIAAVLFAAGVIFGKKFLK